MTQEQLKKKYGWSEELEKFFIDSNPSLNSEFRGSFRIKKHKENYFWYYRISKKVKGRDKYLCSVVPNDLQSGQTSFQFSCKVLLEKIDSNFNINKRNQKYLITFIDLYIEELKDELVSIGGRNETTIKSMITSMNDFHSWSEDKKLKINQVPTKEFKTIFRDYIKDLSEREKKNKKGSLSRGTIKSYSQDVRYFLDWLCTDKLLGGIEVLPSHPISLEIQNYFINSICGEKRTSLNNKPFREEYYNKCYNDCLLRVREIWIEYCQNNGRIPRIRDKNGKINQPYNTIGRDIVYFISHLQLRGGFRIGEVFYSYRNRDIFNTYHLKTSPKEMGSFWEKGENGWELHIYNSKGKDRIVPVNDTIWSWDTPPEWIEFEKVPDKTGFHYETPIMDIIMELFPQSYYTFPSPNYHEKPNESRSITYYMNIFKDELVIKKEWEKYGVSSSHDLRSFFISHSIRRDDLTPYNICEITGHTISVMEKYYIRENLKSKLDTFKKLNQRELIKKKN